MWRYWPDVAVAGSPIRAGQISSLRTAIDEDLAAAGLAPHPWTWTNVGPGDRILAVQFTEMRAAIQRLWDHRQMGPLPAWTSGVTPGGPSVGTAATPARATDLIDLRLWLNKYGDYGQQGVSSFSFDPNQASRPVVGANWISDLVALRDVSLPRLYVRCTIVAGSGNTFGSTEISGYSQAFTNYLGSGVRPYALFTRSFYNDPGVTPDPNATLVNFTNDYIDQFVARLKAVLPAFYDAGLRDCIIWNEPNVTGKDELMPVAANFAALLYHSWFAIREALTPPRSPISMYWGGVQFGQPEPGADPNIPDANALAYMAATYAALEGRAGHATGLPWPWEGANVHVYGDRTNQHFATLFDDWVHGLRLTTHGDTTQLLVGEWGFQITGPSDQIGRTFDNLRSGGPFGTRRADKMFWFSHNFVNDLGALYGLREWDIQAGQPFGTYVQGAEITPFYGILNGLFGP